MAEALVATDLCVQAGGRTLLDRVSLAVAVVPQPAVVEVGVLAAAEAHPQPVVV